MLRGREFGITVAESPLRTDGQVYEFEKDNRGYLVYDMLLSFEGQEPIWFRGVMPQEEMTEVGAIATVIQIAFICLPGLTLLAAFAGYLLT